MPDGKPDYINLHTQDKSEAEMLFAEWARSRKSDDPAVQRGEQPVSGYFQDYLDRRAQDLEIGDIQAQSVQRYKNILRPFIAFFSEGGQCPGLTMRELTGEIVNGYLRARMGQGRFNGRSKVLISKKGLRKEWRFIGSILRRAFKKRILLEEITEDVMKLKVAQEATILPTMAEIFEVRDLIVEQAVRDFITVAMNVGLRFNELAHMKFNDVDFTKGIMRIIPDKAGNNPLKTEESIRVIDTPIGVEVIFKRIRDARRGEPESAYVFVDENGQPFFEYPNLVYRRLTKALRKANKVRKASGRDPIPYFGVHRLRHWFVSWCLTRPENRMTIAELVLIVGHCDFEMILKKYLHRTIEADTVRRMRETRLVVDEQGEDDSEASA